jgi:hypothetical protein
MEHHNPLMKERRGKARHTPGREYETPRSIRRREEYEGEKGKGTIPPKRGTLKVQEEETHIIPWYRVVGESLGTPPEESRHQHNWSLHSSSVHSLTSA